MSYAVSQVAKLAGVTVRTLHHYDEIGLLSPERAHGRRLPALHERDLERLQQILYYRELGFALDEIATILDDPDADASAHLRRQHGLLPGADPQAAGDDHGDRVRDGGRQMGISLTPEERFEVFGDFDPDRYAEEAEQRWGGTDAYAESVRRTNRYTKDDWQRFQAESAEWGRRFAAAMDAGAPADDPGGDGPGRGAPAADQPVVLRLHVRDPHRAGGHVPRRPALRGHYENLKPGMARYLHDAIHANAITRA